MNILVLDGRNRASLQVIRSLSKNRHKIFIGEAFYCSSFLSNKIYKKVSYPNPDLHPNEFFDKIKNIVIHENIDFILPIRDSTFEILSRRKNELPNNCKVFIAEINKINLLKRKDSLMKLAKSLGVPIPKTIFLNTEILEYEQIIQKLGSPFIAKPVLSSGSRGIYLIKNKKDNNRFFLENPTNDYILQEYIPHGGAIGVHLLYNDSKIVAFNTHVRIREYPHSGGPSTLRRSGKHKLCEYLSFLLLDKVKWHGPAMVEFRIDKNKKIPYLMKINPRFWGSLAVDIHSGVDFPNLIIQETFQDLNNRADNSRRSGVVVRWLFLGDFLWFLTHGNKLAALKQFLNFKNQKFDILSLDDPLPVVGACIEGLVSLMKKSRRDHAFKRGWKI